MVHFLLLDQRALRMIWMAWCACGNTIPVADDDEFDGAFFSTRPWARPVVECAAGTSFQGSVFSWACRAHRIGEVFDTVQQLAKQRGLVGLGFDVDPTEHHRVAVVDRGQQVPRPSGVSSRAAQRLPINGHRSAGANGRFGARRSPTADRGVELIAIKALQRAPDR